MLRGTKDTLCDKQLIKKDKRKQKPSALLKAPIISCMLIAFASSYYADKKRSPPPSGAILQRLNHKWEKKKNQTNVPTYSSRAASSFSDSGKTVLHSNMSRGLDGISVGLFCGQALLHASKWKSQHTMSEFCSWMTSCSPLRVGIPRWKLF